MNDQNGRLLVQGEDVLLAGKIEAIEGARHLLVRPTVGSPFYVVGNQVTKGRLPSRYQIGEIVSVSDGTEEKINGKIVGIKFETNGVNYDIELTDGAILDVDSIDVNDAVPEPTATPEPTVEPLPTPTPEPTVTPVPTTPNVTPVPLETPTATAEISTTPEPTPDATVPAPPTETPSVTPDLTQGS